MLDSVWRKGNPHTLLVGKLIGAATMENSMEASQKIKIELPYCQGPALVDPGNSKGRRSRHGKTYLFRNIKRD